MVEAHKLVKLVLLHQHYFHDDNLFQQQFDFAEILRRRGLDTRHQFILAKLQKSQMDVSKKDARYFFNQFLLEKAIHDRDAVHNQARGDLNIPSVLNALETHYQMNKHALINHFLLQSTIVKIDPGPLIQSLVREDRIPLSLLSGSPMLLIQHEIYKTLNKQKLQTDDIYHIHKLLVENEVYLTELTLNEFYTYLRNICILAYSEVEDRTEIDTILFNLYKESLERGFLHYEGKLHASRYFAVSSNAIRLGKLEWALEFIEKYRHDLIGETETQDIYRLNLAYYFFGKKQFAESLDQIPPTIPYVDYLLHAKRLELKCLYELRSDLLSYKLDAFKMFLSRTSPKLLSEKNRRVQTDFANFLTQLMNSAPGDQKRAEKLVARLREKKNVEDWRWLMAKAKSL
jgi:hypothetical protein